jgi:hypothetical protein
LRHGLALYRDRQKPPESGGLREHPKIDEPEIRRLRVVGLERNETGRREWLTEALDAEIV